MSDVYDDTVYDEPVDDDLDVPEDGRDGQPYEGSSDAPETMNELDPLKKHRYLLDDDLQVEGEFDEGADPEEEELEEWVEEDEDED